MYEPTIDTFQQGLHSIDIGIQTEQQESLYEDRTAYLTASFAVTTESLGTITVTSDGLITSAFGGLGVSDSEFREYCLLAIRLFELVCHRPSPVYTTSRDVLSADTPDDIPDSAHVIPSPSMDVSYPDSTE